jgi:hypothetical protein
LHTTPFTLHPEPEALNLKPHTQSGRGLH